MTIAELYERIINLEALDRRLKVDIANFVTQNDKLGAEIATEARRSVQNDMFALQQIYDQFKRWEHANGKPIKKQN